MRPNDFILNSDYLSIAQIDNSTYTITIGAGTLQPYPQTGWISTQTFDFTIPSQQGIIDRILIKKDSSDYALGSKLSFTASANVSGYVNVYRASKTKLRVDVTLNNIDNANPSSYPNMTFKVKVARFYPPNVF